MCEYGDERVRSGFLFRPKIISGEIRRWCWATWVEEYIPVSIGRIQIDYFWKPTRWVDWESEIRD